MLVAGIALIIAGVSLAQGEKPKAIKPAESGASTQEKGQGPSAEKGMVIVSLESRDKKITVIRGSKGTVYTISTKDGKPLAANISEGDLKAKYPDLYKQIKHGLAGNDATLRPWSVPAQTPAR